MTWFQLVDAYNSDPEPQRPSSPRARRLAPNSALFLNPTLPLQAASEARPAKRHLRLVKGSRVGSAEIPSAA